jgi:hypothetical protein
MNLNSTNFSAFEALPKPCLFVDDMKIQIGQSRKDQELKYELLEGELDDGL